MEDFKDFRGRRGEGCGAVGVDGCGAMLDLAKVSVDTADGVSCFTLKKKTVDVAKLRSSCTDRFVSEAPDSSGSFDLDQLRDLTLIHSLYLNLRGVWFPGSGLCGNCDSLDPS